jgi:hypothetical protein
MTDAKRALLLAFLCALALLMTVPSTPVCIQCPVERLPIRLPECAP